MTTFSSILKIGNSCGIIIPAKILKSLSLSEKDKVILSDAGGRLILKKAEEDQTTPFSALDIWYEEHGYTNEESIEDSLGYVKEIRSERIDKEIQQW